MSRSNALMWLLLLALSCWSWCGAVTARPTPSASTSTSTAGGGFIRSWCAGTDYPALCNATLAPYAAEVGASPARLSLAALTVTLDGARRATAAMKAMAAGGASSHHLVPVAAEAAADCVGMLEDAVDLLRQSVEAMERLGKEPASASASASGQAGRSVRFQVNSVQTWASAALTNDGMCMEGFKGQPAVVKEAVRRNVAGAMHLTAIALAIINAMAKQM
jgi:pectinesterase inhibitor-like protein